MKHNTLLTILTLSIDQCKETQSQDQLKHFFCNYFIQMHP